MKAKTKQKTTGARDRAPMHAADFVQARGKLGLTTAQMADAIGVTLRAVQYWESGERAIPPMAEKLVDNLLAAKASANG